MGFFSRNKDKKLATAASRKTTPSINTAHSNASIHSASSLRSPFPTQSRNKMDHILSPGLPRQLPRVDLPRPPDPHIDPVGYLRSLWAVRERSRIVTEKAFRNELRHFDVDMSMFPNVVSFVARIIKVREGRECVCEVEWERERERESVCVCV